MLKHISYLSILFITLVAITACGNTSAETNSSHDDHEQADHKTGDSLMAMDAKARVTGPNGAVYMHLVNHTDQDDALVGASTDIAETVEIHETTIDENEVMQMRPVEKLVIPAGDEVMLAQGGLHVMLINVQKEVGDGDSFELTLNFEHADPVQLTVPVKNDMTGGHGMDHSNH